MIFYPSVMNVIKKCWHNLILTLQIAQIYLKQLYSARVDNTLSNLLEYLPIFFGIKVFFYKFLAHFY